MDNAGAESGWERIRELFARASELPPEEREEFLAHECNGDEGLRAGVRKLLAVQQEQPAFLEKPIARLSQPLESVPAFQPLLTAGDMIEGRFRIENEIGSGGFSCVYLAIDTQLHGKKVIVKVIRAGSDEQWMLRRFAAEVEALARINDPGVVSVIGYGQTPAGLPYVIMQYIEGLTMRALMNEQRPPWLLDRVLRFMQQIAGGLAAVHKEGICHRDVRPENIVVRNPGHWNEQAVIIDFGIATVAKQGDSGATTRVVGSPEYMAPEQLMGRPTPASDVYSLGTLAFELLSGRKLHSCDMPAGPGPVIESVLASMPDHIRAALDRAVKWDERSRFQTVMEFVHALTPTTDARVWRLPDFLVPNVTGTGEGASVTPGARVTRGSDSTDPESLTQAFRLQGQTSASSSGDGNPDSLTQAFRMSPSSDELPPRVQPTGPTPPVIAQQEASSSDPESLTAAFRVSSGKVAATPMANPLAATREFITSRQTSADPESSTGAFETRRNTPPYPTKSPAGNGTAPTDILLDMFKPEQQGVRQSAHTPQRPSTSNASASAEVQSILNNKEALFQNAPVLSHTPGLHRTDALKAPALEPRSPGGPSEYTKILRVPQPSAPDAVTPSTPGGTVAGPSASNRKLIIAIVSLNVIALIGIAVVFWVLRT